MRVSICKNIDIESEVDVDVHDVLAEFCKEAELSSPKHHRILLACIDQCTRSFFAKISDKIISAVNDSARKEIVKRLRAEADRWEVKQSTAT